MTVNALAARLRRMTGMAAGDLSLLEQAVARTKTLKAGADLAHPGDSPDSLHVVVKGWAARYRVLPDGRRHFPALFIPGDLCDLDGLHLRRSDFGLCALTACEVAVLSHERCRAMMEESPVLRDALWWLNSWENAVVTEWAVGLGRRSADERLAHLLCEIFVRLWSVDLTVGNGCAFPLTQTELSDVLGLSTVHVNRMVFQLRDLGLITLDRRWLTIHDFGALMTMGSFDADYLHVEELHGRGSPWLRGEADPAGAAGGEADGSPILPAGLVPAG